MPLLRTQRSKFRFSASSPVAKTNATTNIDIRVPSAPWRVRGVQPTITAVFKSRDGIRAQLGAEFESDPEEESDNEDGKARSRASTPGSDGHGLSPENAADASSEKSERYIDLGAQDVALSRKGKARQEFVFYPSVTSIEDGPSVSRHKLVPTSHPTSHASTGTVPADTDIWTDYGVQNGEPVFIRQRCRSSTKDKDCITSWWECYSRVPLREPPTLSDRKDLALGDIFCDRVIGVDMPKLWIWATSADSPSWTPISEGDTREDGRRLYITPKKKRPSWVKSEWCVKQMLKQHRPQSVPRT